MRISDWSSDVCSSDLLGITGSDWANKRLNEVSGDGGVIDFSVGADADADESLRYLRNKGGVFGAIYSTQMSEMGLVHFPGPDQPNHNPVCSDTALPLADADASELGGIAGRFFNVVDAANIESYELGSFLIGGAWWGDMVIRVGENQVE